MIAYFSSFALIAIAAILLGIGTALVYPTFLAAIADYSHPQQRAECIGVYRLWRDLGYALGALASGLIADVFGLQAAYLKEIDNASSKKALVIGAGGVSPSVILLG